MKKEGGTKVGNFLRNVKGIAPSILQLAGTITGVDGLNDLADKIKGSDTIKQEDKDVALELLKMDLVEMQEVTKRWESDNLTDSFLSKNVRPMALIFLTLFMTFIIFTDSKELWKFDVKDSYISLLETLLLAVYLAYFGSRGVEKYQKIKK
tara:strand:+ start:1405 stop:1857 length:453 start_codon:yes stop_codon:yes gene_type:complete